MQSEQKVLPSESRTEKVKIILASKSPRRIELLRGLGLSPEIIPANVSEALDAARKPPSLIVTTLAERKARAVPAQNDALVIAADTLVFLDEEPLGKPAGETQARAMLRRLSGRAHFVYTGIAVRRGEQCVCRAEKTAVFFRELSDEEIERYLATGEPFDKAGAYGIQGRGALLVDSIDGDYFNVVGLPLSALFVLIREAFGLTPEDLL